MFQTLGRDINIGFFNKVYGKGVFLEFNKYN